MPSNKAGHSNDTPSPPCNDKTPSKSYPLAWEREDMKREIVWKVLSIVRAALIALRQRRSCSAPYSGSGRHGLSASSDGPQAV